MERDEIFDSRYSWVRLAVTLAIAAVGNVGMWAIIVIMPAVQAEFGIDRAASALPYTLTMLGFALGNLVIGRAVDRFGITAALIGAAVGIASGFALAAAAGSILALAFVHLLIGFATAASFGPLIADISHWFQRRRGIAVAVAASGNYLSGTIWPTLLAGVLAETGWRAVYLSLAAVTLGLMVPLALFLRRRLPADAMLRAEGFARARVGEVSFPPSTLMLLLGLAGIGCCIGMSMPQVHIVSLSDDLGHGAEAGARMLSLALMGGVISRLASGFLADRLGGVRTLLLGSSLQCLALFLYLPAEGLYGLYAVSLIFGLAQGGIVPSYAIIVREYMPPREAGARVGFVIMATIFGMAAGGWLSGWIHDVSGSYRLAFVNGIGWNMLNIAIITLILLSGRRRPARTA